MESSHLLTCEGTRPFSVRTDRKPPPQTHCAGNDRQVGEQENHILVQSQKPKNWEKKRRYGGMRMSQEPRAKKGPKRAKGRVWKRAEHSADWWRWGVIQSRSQSKKGWGEGEGCAEGSRESGSPLQAKQPPEFATVCIWSTGGPVLLVPKRPSGPEL